MRAAFFSERNHVKDIYTSHAAKKQVVHVKSVQGNGFSMPVFLLLCPIKYSFTYSYYSLTKTRLQPTAYLELLIAMQLFHFPCHAIEILPSVLRIRFYDWFNALKLC